MMQGICQCRRWDLNPHERNAHYALNVARLPIPPLRLEYCTHRVTKILPGFYVLSTSGSML
jgi:hypothetical protein